MSFATVTLNDGSKVHQGTCTAVTLNLKVIKEENSNALAALVEKCKDVKYRFPDSPEGDKCRTILQEYDFIVNDADAVDPEIRKIVLNSVEGSGASLRLINPIKKDVSQL
jgi:hypothetical protein